MRGVCGENARNIGPDLDILGIQRGSDQGGRVIGPSPPDGGRDPVDCGADESRRDDHFSRPQPGQELFPDATPGELLQDGGLREVVIGSDQISRVHQLGGDSVLPEDFRENQRAQTFAEGGDTVHAPGTGLPQQMESLNDIGHLLEEGSQRRFHTFPSAAREELTCHRPVQPRQLIPYRPGGIDIPGRGGSSHLQQSIGALAHGGQDHDLPPGQLAPNDLDCPRHRVRVLN